MFTLIVEMIIMKTIQITLPDDMHQQAKSLALAARKTLKQFVADAIEAHVVRMEAMTPTPSPSKQKGGR